VGTSYNSSILFMHFIIHLSVPYFIIFVIMKAARSWSSHLPWEPVKVIFLIRALFALAHFRTLHSITYHFPSCLFPFITDDIHIVSPLVIVSSTYEHFQIELNKISLSTQFLKCATWSPYGVLFNFDTPSIFNTPWEGIKVLGGSIRYLILHIIFHKKCFIGRCLACWSSP
jgi:hypothetical protein